MTKKELLDLLMPFPDDADIKLDLDAESVESAEIGDANLEEGIIKLSVNCAIQS